MPEPLYSFSATFQGFSAEEHVRQHSSADQIRNICHQSDDKLRDRLEYRIVGVACCEAGTDS